MKNDTLTSLNSIPASGYIRTSTSSAYACLSDKHLHGFTPVARYGVLVDESKSHHEFHKQSAKDYLLLSKAGQYFVDAINGCPGSRGFGLNPKPQALSEISLPEQVLNFFKQFTTI